MNSFEDFLKWFSEKRFYAQSIYIKDNRVHKRCDSLKPLRKFFNKAHFLFQASDSSCLTMLVYPARYAYACGTIRSNITRNIRMAFSFVKVCTSTALLFFILYARYYSIS